MRQQTLTYPNGPTLVFSKLDEQQTQVQHFEDKKLLLPELFSIMNLGALCSTTVRIDHKIKKPTMATDP